MKKRYLWTITAIPLILTIISLTGCGKDQPVTNHVPNITGGSSIETTNAASPKVMINDISVYVGDNIDYMSAIQSAENMEVSKSMISIDSSMVDPYTPGIYLVTYTFDYMGILVTQQISVSIKPAPSQEEISETSITPSNTPDSEATQNTPSAPSQTTPSETASSTVPSTAQTAPLDVTVEEQIVPNAEITLSSGKVTTIQCTASRYIVETYTDDTYFEENSYTYLKSELKVIFNSGEVQVIETVINRVLPPG